MSFSWRTAMAVPLSQPWMKRNIVGFRSRPQRRLDIHRIDLTYSREFRRDIGRNPAERPFCLHSAAKAQHGEGTASIPGICDVLCEW